MRKKSLLLWVAVLISTLLNAQENNDCADCVIFNADGDVETRSVKESIIGDPSQPVSVRVKELIAQMTLEEKVGQLVNRSDSIPRLNLPAYDYWNECLHGVARAGDVTVFPQSINLASTWDTLLIKQVATAISTEARLKNRELGKGLTYWSPTINMARDPRWGRNEETYGEDPYLTSRLGVAFVQGLQGNHPKYLKTVATVKHFVANNKENDRFSISSQIPTKQLYEYYFPAFEACVKEGNVQSVMTSYNAFNGVAPSASTWLLGDVLRKEWGFDGFVVSDCGAIGVVNWQHRMVNSLEETVALCVNSGCDLECGDIYRDKLVNAVHQGLITEDVIDRALTRVLTARFKLGEFDSIQSVPYNHYDKKLLAGKEFSALAYEAAVKSLVLLKNDNHFLPVDKNKVRSVAVIGPFADNNYLGGYSGHPVNNISLLKGVRELLGSQVDISYLEGTSVVEPISERYLLAADKKTHGLTAEYIASENIQDNPLFEQCDTTINFEWGDESPDKRLNKDNFSIRWHGYLKSPVSGERILGIYADGGIRIWMDGVLILDEWDSHSLHYYTAKVQLEKGKAIPLKVEYVNRTGAATCILTSDFSHLERMEDIKKTISGKDLVLVALGSDWKLARENRDLPSIYLPMAQEQMLKEICKTNPNVVLIYHTGNPLTSVWADEHVPAILQAWYPGQEGGRALANVIFGLENPSGRLPMTIYRSEEQLPDISDYDIWKGRTYQYLETSPLYAFGYGLSYSTFQYNHLKSNDAICSGDSLSLSVEVTNLSDRAGEEVVQVYIHRENTPVYTYPLKKLVAFQRVKLKPHETKQISLTVHPRQMSVWNDGVWKVLSGKYTLFVGGGQPDNGVGISKTFDVSIKR